MGLGSSCLQWVESRPNSLMSTVPGKRKPTNTLKSALQAMNSHNPAFGHDRHCQDSNPTIVRPFGPDLGVEYEAQAPAERKFAHTFQSILRMLGILCHDHVAIDRRSSGQTKQLV